MTPAPEPRTEAEGADRVVAALRARLREVEGELATAEVERDGANERAVIMLTAKNEWADRARHAEHRVAGLADAGTVLAQRLRRAYPDPMSPHPEIERALAAWTAALTPPPATKENA